MSESADAVLVLSGDYGDRLTRGLDLIRRDVARTLVLAGNPDSLEAEQLCQKAVPFEVVCLRPNPDSTRAEARAAAELAAARGWDRVVVVTSTPHVARSRLLFERCLPGDLDTVGTTPPYDLRRWIEVVIHEWLGVLAALTTRRGC